MSDVELKKYKEDMLAHKDKRADLLRGIGLSVAEDEEDRKAAGQTGTRPEQKAETPPIAIRAEPIPAAAFDPDGEPIRKKFTFGEGRVFGNRYR